MESNVEPIKEILDELYSLLETLETQNLALLQFLKDQGMATEEKLAPYLDRAENASSVKWRAARARMQYLLAPVQKETKEKPQEKPEEKAPEKQQAEKSDGEKRDAAKVPGGAATTGTKQNAKSPDDKTKPPANDQKS